MAYIGFHFQNSPNRWPDAVANLRDGTIIKFLFGVERCREAKGINPNLKTWYRWVGAQPLPYNNFEQHCRDWLNQFVDGTFRREAEHVDYIQGYNETLANSQPPEEKARWIALHTAMAKVWHDEYRQEPELAHIRIILCETAIGNDIPWQIAAAAVKYDAILGWHPYIVCRNGQVSPHDWEWYSGRWATKMDAEFLARGIHVDWAFGEGGPVLDASTDWSGWLDPLGGWRNPDCLNGDLEKYKQVLSYWLQNTFNTQAYQEGRVLGVQLFTSGAPGGSGGQWGNFDLIGDDMQQIAAFSGAYDYPPVGESPEPPEPPPCTDWQAELWAESIRLQTIQLNPNAALQAGIFQAGFVPVESEFWHTIDDIQYAAQAAEHLQTGARRVYYAVVPDWNRVSWFSLGNQLHLANWPADSRVVTQWFGENVEIYREKFGLCCGHNGIDLAMIVGQPIYATLSGTITKAQTVDDDGYGLHVRMKHDGGYESRYAHLSRLTVCEGQDIIAGSLVGFSGNTGFSTGPHLHYEIRKDGVAIDPWPYLEVIA